MPGRIMKALPLTVYDFGPIPLNTSYTFTAGRVIDVSDYREATLVVRRHAYFSTGSTSWQVRAYISGFTPDDVRASFTGASPVADTGTLGSGTGPAVFLAPFSVPFGGAVVVAVTLFQVVGIAPATGYVSISVDIVGKS